jgi:ferric-dicitrate binding protein FerR (iron transport regulator)
MSGASVGRPWRKLSSKGDEAERRACRQVVVVEGEGILGKNRKADVETRDSSSKRRRSAVNDGGFIFSAAVAVWWWWFGL